MRTAAAKWMILIFCETEASTLFTRKNEVCRPLVGEWHVFYFLRHRCKLLKKVVQSQGK